METNTTLNGLYCTRKAMHNLCVQNLGIANLFNNWSVNFRIWPAAHDSVEKKERRIQ